MESGLNESVLEALGISTASVIARGLRRYEEASTLALADVGDDGREYLLTPLAGVA